MMAIARIWNEERPAVQALASALGVHRPKPLHLLAASTKPRRQNRRTSPKGRRSTPTRRTSFLVNQGRKSTGRIVESADRTLTAITSPRGFVALSATGAAVSLELASFMGVDLPPNYTRPKMCARFRTLSPTHAPSAKTEARSIANKSIAAHSVESISLAASLCKTRTQSAGSATGNEMCSFDSPWIPNLQTSPRPRLLSSKLTK
jgi:hypothetical protein